MLDALVFLAVLFQGGALKVTDIHVGTGDKAANGDVMTMLYKGTLKNGKVFDQNFDTAPPFAFPLGAGKVIKGWDKGLLGMKVGGERKLVIPSDMAYGNHELQGIPANSTLYFDVKLLRIDKPGEKQKIQIVDLVKGKGRAAKDGDTVGVLYTGKFLNGVKFDSSYDHLEKGKPTPFSVTLGAHSVVPGFEQGLVGMKVGGKRQVTIPYELGYGEQGGGPIPGESTLVFTLEMKSISGG